MLNIGANGFTDHPYDFEKPMEEIAHATDRRLFAIADALAAGIDVNTIHGASYIDLWFLKHLADINDTKDRIVSEPLKAELIRTAKQKGFSDKTIAKLKNTTEQAIRKTRIKANVLPVIKQIDTLAGEFDAETNYLYLTYHGNVNDIESLGKKAVAIIGSGPYCIGSSVEFDWSAVNTAKTLAKRGYKTIMINSNPETVSTDFDRSDRLYFDELTFERIQDIADFEQPHGIVVSVGGQIANNLALPLATAGYSILGTAATQIDNAEDRQKFSAMLNRLGIDQPEWSEVTTLEAAKKFGTDVGYPLLIRPSYVLSGGAMNVVQNEQELDVYMNEATRLSPDHPVVISRFILNAKELEIDGVAQNGKLVIYAISEHIENAGVHSGDATVVYPAQKLYLETVRQAKQIAKKVVKNLDITGPFNIQFLAKDNELKVIETNVRASRSFPFVSKVSGHNFISIATDAMLGIKNDTVYQTLELDHVGVKNPQFSYNRLKGADPVAGVEMASTGEVACFGDDIEEAFYTSWLATDQHIAGKHLFLSLPPEQKHKFVEEASRLVEDGWRIYSTKGTHDYLKTQGIETTHLYKISDKKEPSVLTALLNKKFDLVINIPTLTDTTTDGAVIRRQAIDNHIPMLTNAETGRLLLRCLSEPQLKDIQPKYWQEYVPK
jgi:carbamoyl-phosphate synthase large subunit